MTAQDLAVFDCPLEGIRFVEASAGTGKTWNIAALYLRLLLERPLEVGQVLVVTFTKAATAELRHRIRARIVETLGCLQGTAPADNDPFVPDLLQTLRVRGIPDETLRRRLDLALQSFDDAAIFTIHGFCQRALADAPFASGMPLALDVLPDDRELLEQAVRDHWRRHLSTETLSPLLARELLSKPRAVAAHVALLERRLARPLARLIWDGGVDSPPPLDAAPAEAAFARAAGLWHTEADAVRAWFAQPTVCLRRTKGDYPEGCVESLLSAWDAFATASDPVGALPDKLALLGVGTLAKKTLKGKPLPTPHPFLEAIQAFVDAREELSQALALHRRRVQRDLLTTAPEAVRRAKQTMRAIGYDDMLGNLHDRLSDAGGPALAAALRRRFPVALVDEFQDTDPLQFEIFRAIHAGPGKDNTALFLVGDPKQSIYGFRSADLHVYLRARALADGHYTLRDNQRSSDDMITAVNTVFSANAHAFVQQGLAFFDALPGARRPVPLQDASGEPRAALQLWSLEPADDGRPIPATIGRQRAIEASAAEIARLLSSARQSQVTLGARELRAADIAVLVRSHREGVAMREALAALGLGSVERSQQSLFESVDAEDLERVLAAVLEPSRDGLLRRALATGLLGWSAQDVDALATGIQRHVDVLSRFHDYRDSWARRGIGVMLKLLMADERVVERMLARVDGERRLTNLAHLAECLHAAAEAHPAPEALLRWLKESRTGAAAENEAAQDAQQLRLESDRNLVQVVTVHSAKGLEFPIVFCPTLFDGSAGRQNSRDCREYHADDGTLVLDFRETLDDNTAQSLVEARAREAAAERLRLIYVALTRAVHRCYLVVGPYRVGKSDKPGCRAPLNWLVAGDGHDPVEWLCSKEPLVGATEVRDAWQRFAASQAPHVALAPLPTTPGRRLAPQRPAPGEIAALDAPAHIPPAWRRTSYSALVHGSRTESAAADRDLRVARAMPALQRTPESLPPDDILRFARGASAGECIHHLFESIDFTDPSGWSAAIDAALARHPQPATDPSLLPRMLRRMLDDVLTTSLPIGTELARIAPARRFVELGFTLPADGLDAATLSESLATRGYRVPALSLRALQGYLVGFIDLVFEHGGRFHILDWKSNLLGYTPADHGGQELVEAMDREGYHLQYLFYCVALHRYLQARMGPRYDFDTHFGSVLYLFVRGVRPDWQTSDGSAAGVFHHRPERETIEMLSAMFISIGAPA